VRDRSVEWIAAAVDSRQSTVDSHGEGPRRVVIDSREAGPGDLFFGLRGNVDGGPFAAGALEQGAWGVVVAPEWAERMTVDSRLSTVDSRIFAVQDPTAALGRLALAWRRELGCRVIGVTGSTGKTSTKDILSALLAQRWRTHANRENYNTEIGVPLTVLEAERGTEAMVLEMAMRGAGQIAELAAIAEPDVGLIVNVGPVHLELLGTIAGVAAAKAELIRDLRPGASCVVPAEEPLLAPHLRDDLETITFGPEGDVWLGGFHAGRAEIHARGEPVRLELSYREPHNVQNTLAAVAACTALGHLPSGRVDAKFSSLRGEVVDLGGGVTVVNDCYNANPMSVRAALDHLAETPAQRRIAILGTMAELGPGAERYHREVGERADELGIDVLVTVGEPALAIAEGFGGERYAVGTPEEARSILEELAAPGDRVLVKGSRSVGLERVLAG